MIQPSSGRSGIRPRHTATVVGAVAVAAVVAYLAFGFIVGTLAFLVKLAVVVGIGFLAVKLVFRRSRS